MSRNHRVAVALFAALAAGPALEAAGPMLVYRDPQILDVGTGFPGFVRTGAFGDVTGDGRADVVASYGGNRPSSFIAVFAQTAGGTLAAPVSY